MYTHEDHLFELLPTRVSPKKGFLNPLGVPEVKRQTDKSCSLHVCMQDLSICTETMHLENLVLMNNGGPTGFMPGLYMVLTDSESL